MQEGEMKERLTRRVAELAADAVLILDINGRVLDCICREPSGLWGRISGLRLQELWSDELRHEGEEVLEEVRRGRVLRDLVATWGAGEHRAVVSLSMALVDPAEPGAGVVAVVRDITREVEAERRLSSYIRELTEYIRHVERSNQLKDTFADIMRHDILNPLSAIKSAVSSDTVTPRGVELIRKSVERIERIVEMFSKYALLHGVDGLELREGNLSEVLDEAADSLSPVGEERGIRIVRRYPAYLHARFSPFLEEAVANLLSNAVKFSPPGCDVVLEAQREGNSVVIKVRDLGEGVPDRYKKSIFERFVRGKKEGIRGSGLGLAIVRRIAELHGGEVWVEDNVVEHRDASGRIHQEKRGSVFVLRIPAGGEESR
ncbi:MAG: hypothetical protein GXO66_09580 [Euryarchaeota archaeon]|nr:hypothetical protein [Euryarchaeota archaeon]